MKADKRKRIEAKGWSEVTVAELPNLTPEEAAFIELKLSLSKKLKSRRVKLQISQTELAKKLRSSQSRVAKMEAGDPSVSIDLLMRALLATGATNKEIARAID